MRFDNRIVNFGDTHATAHLTDDQLMETYVLAGDNRHLARLPAVQGALRRARCARCSRCSEAAVREADARVHRRAAARPARSHHAAHRAPRSSGRGRRVPAPARAGAPARASHARPCAPLGRGRRGRRPRRRRVPRLRRWIGACASAAPSISAVQQSTVERVAGAAAPRPTTSSSSRSTRRWSARASREMRPELSAIDVMTTPLEIRESVNERYVRRT